MANKVSGVPFLPPYQGQVIAWANALVLTLQQIFTQYAGRINTVLPEDGSEAMTGPLKLVPLTYSQLAAITPSFGMIVAVSNANTNTPGATITGAGSDHVFAGYNNSAWIVL